MTLDLRDNRMMQEAVRLAADGEVGNSDAIRLLQIPHSADDIKEVLSRFENQLTPQARSKLSLAALVPLPYGVDNQRYEPIFDKYPISGKTYTTASGTVCLDEVQYYNGQMVQLYGECTNLAQVTAALAGTAYKPVTLRYADGRETAVVQFWSHKLTDTSLWPYNAMFIILPVVPDTAAADKACIKADDNGASSALSALQGNYDPQHGVYENLAQLFFVRLLDSTAIAIEVGRERMGTDKRPGTIDVTREGNQVTWSVKDGRGNGVARGTAQISDDFSAYSPRVAQAAATAGIPLRPLPVGTEYVYPAIARIGNGPIVNWQWRTDLVPRLQPALADTISFDSSSEEGELLIRWGFTPKMLAYVPNVRGVVTLVPEAQSPQPARHPAVSGAQLADAQSVVRSGAVGARPEPQVPWSEEQWTRARQVILEEARNTRVAAKFLPIHGPLPPETTYVRRDDLRYDRQALRLTVDDTNTIPLLTLQSKVYLRGAQLADPAMTSALQLLRRAANVLARLEDIVIFLGQPGSGPSPRRPASRPAAVWQRALNSLPRVYELLGGHSSWGLASLQNQKIPPATDWNEPVPVRPYSTEPGSRHENGESLVSAVSECIGQLEGEGHFGPYAVVLDQSFFTDVTTPNKGSLVLPQDRILPFLRGGPLLRSSVLPEQTGVVVALGGAAVDLVVATDMSLGFLQVTTDPLYVFRVFERIALRIKQPRAIVVLDTDGPAARTRSKKRVSKQPRPRKGLR